MKKHTCIIVLSFFSFQNWATNYFVSASETRGSNGKTKYSPYLTIQKASNSNIASNTVFVLTDVFCSIYETILIVTRSGTANNYITYETMKGHTPKITATNNLWNAVSTNGSYIAFEDLELIGNDTNITNKTLLLTTQWLQMVKRIGQIPLISIQMVFIRVTMATSKIQE